MALFGSGKIEPTIENSIKNKEEFESLMIACELAEMDQESLQEFCEKMVLASILLQKEN